MVAFTAYHRLYVTGDSFGGQMAGKGKPGRRVGHRELGEHQCKACAHPELARIDFLCASGGQGQLTAVAAQFGLTKHCVYYHFRRHVSDR